MSTRATCLELETQWARFVTGPLWREWRNDDEPPAGASKLNAALFMASRYHRSSATGTLGVRQLRRIVEMQTDQEAACDIDCAGDVTPIP